MEKDFTFKETIEILKKVNAAWDAVGVVGDNPYNMATERYFDEWEEVGDFTLPFASNPVSTEVANKNCLHYYVKNDIEYLWIGEFRYALNEDVKALLSKELLCA